ncbi:MAG: helix-turn-helix domain-containing protein, partial [Victivallales bacterium]|nr:helix-turn-helix domain-containing protein [Victivallales bacterium]
MDKKILLAKRLQNQAKISNITQSDIANYLDISQPFVSDVLSGKKQLNGTIFEKLIDFLGFSREEKIDLQYLFVEVKTGFS